MQKQTRSDENNEKTRTEGGARHAFMVTTFFLAVVFFLMAVFATVVVALHAKTAEPILTISRGESLVTEPVRFPDMSPGDSVGTQIKLRVAHKETVTLHLRVDLSGELSTPLADALDVSISVAGKEGALYSGQLTKASDITLTLFGEEKTEDIRFDIVTTLSEDADEAVQGEALSADYVWWVEEAELLRSIQNSWMIVAVLILLLVIAVVLALLQLAFLPERRKARKETAKRGGNHAGKRAR